MTVIRNMADLHQEAWGIDLSGLTASERAGLAGSMLSGGQVNEALRATASPAQVYWTERGAIVLDERQAREAIASDCIQLCNALEALR